MSEFLRKELHEKNRISWNAVTPVHNSHKRDQAGFLRAGGSTLDDIDLGLLGDVRGQRLVHLQCNCGQDSLSIAARGAIVTGVDISDEAIAFAVQLSKDSGIPAAFERSDIFDWFERTAASAQRFDIAYTSYGTIGWLSDIGGWARGIASILRPGGRLVFIEYHPFWWMFDTQWRMTQPYFGSGRPIIEAQGVHDYVGASGDALTPSGRVEGVAEFTNPHATYEFQWTISDVLSALLAAGMRLTHFGEYPFSNGFKFAPDMRPLPGGRFAHPANVPAFPLMYSVCAERAGT
ncbi:MAG: class I SAM-dependent methyltransferase [Phycisphaerales bacterium]|nr:class I SAM-dependent methyltransferase [Phycisphaerales bacterium]